MNPFDEGLTMDDVRASGVVLYAADTESSPESPYFGSVDVVCQLLDEKSVSSDATVLPALER